MPPPRATSSPPAASSAARSRCSTSGTAAPCSGSPTRTATPGRSSSSRSAARSRSSRTRPAPASGSEPDAYPVGVRTRTRRVTPHQGHAPRAVSSRLRLVQQVVDVPEPLGAAPPGGEVIAHGRRVAGDRVGGDEPVRPEVPDAVVLQHSARRRPVGPRDDVGERRALDERRAVDRLVEVPDRALVAELPAPLVTDRGQRRDLRRRGRGPAVDAPQGAAVDPRVVRRLDEHATVDCSVPRDVLDTTVGADDARDRVLAFLFWLNGPEAT